MVTSENMSDEKQSNEPNYNYRDGSQGSIHLSASLGRHVASDATRMARAADALCMAEEARKQEHTATCLVSNAAAPLTGISRSFARGEATTEEPDAEADEIEKWKRSEDAARIRADLNAARRQSPEIEVELEMEGMRKKIVSRAEAGSAEVLLVGKRSAAWTDTLGTQRDSDKEEMEEDAAWPRRSKKERREDGHDSEPKQGKVYTQAFPFDVADERKPSPEEIPLPHSTAASVASQAGVGSEVPTATAMASGRAGVLPTSASGSVLDALYARSDMSIGERYLIEAIRDWDGTMGRLHAHSKAFADEGHGGLELLEMVFRRLIADGLRKDRTEEYEALLRELVLGGEIEGDRKETARRMVDRMLEEYQHESRALAENLAELSTPGQPKSTENAYLRAQDPLRGRTSRVRSESEDGRVAASKQAEAGIEMERSLGSDLPSRLVKSLETDIARSGINPDELHLPNASVRNRSLFDIFPVNGKCIYFQPTCLSSVKATPSQKDNTIASISPDFVSVPSNPANDVKPLDHARQTSSISDAFNISPTSNAIWSLALSPSQQKRREKRAMGKMSMTTADQAVEEVRVSAFAELDPSMIHRSCPSRSTSGATSNARATLGEDKYAQRMVKDSWACLHPRVSDNTSATPAASRANNAAQPAIHGAWPPHIHPPQFSQHMCDFLHNGGRMRRSVRVDEGRIDDNPLPNYTSLYAPPDADRIFNPKLSSTIPHRSRRRGVDGLERFSFGGEVSASIAALAAASVEEAKENEDALVESAVCEDRSGYSQVIDGARTVAQGLSEEYAKEMRERTMREREERILKRARQISGQNSHLQAPRASSEGSRVAFGGGEAAVRSAARRLGAPRHLELIEPGHQRLAGLREDKSPTGSRLGFLPDVAGSPAPLKAVKMPHDGSPAQISETYNWTELRRGPSPAAEIQNKPCGAAAIAASAPKCTIFHPAYLQSPMPDGNNQANTSVLYHCNTCDGQCDRECMQSEEIHHDRGLDWRNGSTDHREPKSARKSCAELKETEGVGKSSVKGPMAVFDGSTHEAKDLLNNALSVFRDGKFTTTAQEFKLQGGDALEPTKEKKIEGNTGSNKVRKDFYEDCFRESAESARSSAQQSSIPAQQKPLERFSGVKAPCQGATLASAAEAEVIETGAARNNMKTSSGKRHERDSLDGLQSVLAVQGSSVSKRNGEGSKSSTEELKDTMKKASGQDSLNTGTSSSLIDVEGMAVRNKRDEQEEGSFSHDPYEFWVLVQFQSSASDFPRNFPWRSDGPMCGLFGIMSSTTLPSLLSSLEAKVEVELEAMKANKGDPAVATAGVSGLVWLAAYRISGLTVLWNWCREKSPSGGGCAAIPFVRTPPLRTQVTERNMNGVLWMMSKERGHLLLVHTTKRDIEGNGESKDKKEKVKIEK